MKVEQIYTGCLAHAAYYIESNGEAAVFDPLREVQPYLDRAKKDNAKIKDVFEISGITASDIDIVAMPDVSPLKQFRLVTKYAVKTYLETGVFLNNYLME